MSKQQPTFAGAYTAMVSPFREGKLDESRLREQVEYQVKGGIDGLVPVGTTGESPTLDFPEHERVIELTVEAARGRVQVFAGTGANATTEALELHGFARKAGATACLSVNPYYNKPSQEGLYRHFMAVADAAHIPVILYNIPGRSGVALAPTTVERLNKHQNIVAIKEATGSLDSATEICMRCPNLALLSGDDSLTLPFAAVGGVGVVSVVSNILPARVASLCTAFLEGRWKDAAGIHRELFDFSRAMFLETNPIPVKAAMKMLGRDTGALRLPMCDASEATMVAVRKALTAQGLL